MSRSFTQVYLTIKKINIEKWYGTVHRVFLMIVSYNDMPYRKINIEMIIFLCLKLIDISNAKNEISISNWKM